MLLFKNSAQFTLALAKVMSNEPSEKRQVCWAYPSPFYMQVYVDVSDEDALDLHSGQNHHHQQQPR